MAKISVIGAAGRVGSTIALCLALSKIADVVVVDNDERKAKGISLDLQQSMFVYGNFTQIISGNYEDTADSDICVIAAGLPRKPGMTRDELLEVNAKIVKEVCEKIARYSPNAIIIVVTNPLDAMCYVAAEASKFPKSRVVGMAGILDTARFKAFIAEELKVDAKGIDAFILGSHDNDMIPIISHAFVNRRPLTEILHEEKIAKIIERTKNAGAEIVVLSGGSALAPATAVSQMVDAILNDRKWILPCSAYVSGENGASGIFIGVPVILGKDGVERIIELKLSEEERKGFEKAADSIKKQIEFLRKDLNK